MTTTDPTPEPLDASELNARVTDAMMHMLESCAGYTRDPKPETYRVWRAATSQYIELHRRWFKLACPELDYDSVYGAQP